MMRDLIKDWLFFGGATCLFIAIALTLWWDLEEPLAAFLGRDQLLASTPRWDVVAGLGVIGWALAIYGLKRTRRLQVVLDELSWAKRCLARSELRHHVLSAMLPFGLLEYNSEGRIVRSNRRFQTMAGYAPETLQQRRVEELVPDLAEIVPHVVGSIEVDRDLLTSSGDNIRVRLQISSLSERSAGIRGGLVLVRQGTDWNRHSPEPKQLRSALVTGMAHEVRNPLFSISTTLDTFEARAGAANPHRRFFQVLRAEVARMGNLMTELVDYGKPVELKTSMETLRSVIFEAIELCHILNRQRDVTVKVGLDQDLPAIRIDRRHMVQVFRNLVANAVQHSPRGGEVRVRLEKIQGGFQRCAIRDQGVGFAEDALERIFEPFYSKRQGGVGLGLSIVERFVVEQGGSVRAFNHPEGGAVVEVSFPASAATEEHLSPTAESSMTSPLVETEDPREQPGSSTEAF